MNMNIISLSKILFLILKVNYLNIRYTSINHIIKKNNHKN